MSEREIFYTYRDVDYVMTLNRAITHIYFIRAQIEDIKSFIEYLRAVEALYAVLTPRIKPREAGELIKKAKNVVKKRGKLKVNMALLDRALELMIDAIDKSGLLIKGTWLEHNAPEPELMKPNR